MSAEHLTFHPFLTLPTLPENTRSMVARLLLEVPVTAEKLASSVRSYRAKIEDVGQANGRANVELGVAIADALEVILKRVDARTPPEEYCVIQAAVRYFVIENDGSGHDLATEDGLFADARVVNAMLRWFGRDDLYLKVPVPASERRPSRPSRIDKRAA